MGRALLSPDKFMTESDRGKLLLFWSPMVLYGTAQTLEKTTRNIFFFSNVVKYEGESNRNLQGATKI